MSNAVHWLQWATMVVWLLPAALIAGRFWRTLRGRAGEIDAMRAPVFVVCLLQSGFPLHWIIWSHSMPEMSLGEAVFWAQLYLVSIGCALWLAQTHWAMKGKP